MRICSSRYNSHLNTLTTRITTYLSKRYKNSENTKHKFVDKVVLDVSGGKGGNGCVSFFKISPSKKRPTGGNGGRGGNVIIVADKNVQNLNFETYQFKGGDGRHGGSEGLTGRNGTDCIVKVPLGTVVKERLLKDPLDAWETMFDDFVDDDDDDDANVEDSKQTETNACDDSDAIDGDNIEDNSDEEFDCDDDLNNGNSKDKEDLIKIDLDTHHSYVIVAYGGKCGVGNSNIKRFAGTSKGNKSMPKTAMPGRVGERKSLQLELKIIADVGLVGMPNAGKSTLLSVLTNATPKIASYAFTTLHPNIGVIQYSDYQSVTMADIPGLIEGASEDRGLGHEFLKHIERTKMLLYVLDGSHGSTPTSYSSFASRDDYGSDLSELNSVVTSRRTAGRSSLGRSSSSAASRPKCLLSQDLLALYNELKMYDPALVTKPALLFVNKTDLVQPRISPEFKRLADKLKLKVHYGSALREDGLGDLADSVRACLEQDSKHGTDLEYTSVTTKSNIDA